MRRIAIINQKGGVGKTTTAANLGAALARHGKRVVLVDLDPQANLSLFLGIEVRSHEPSMYGVLAGATTIAQTLRDTATPGLRILPSHIDLSGAELELAGAIGRERLLQDALEAWGREDSADYVLIDCPPSLGLLSVNALAAVPEVLITVQTEFFALQGLGKLVEVVQLLRRKLNPELEITGLLPCLYDSRLRLAREVLAELRRYFPGKVYRTSIHSNVKLAESPSYMKTIFEYAPDSTGARDYESLACEVIAQEDDAPDEPPVPAPDPVADELAATARALEGADTQPRAFEQECAPETPSAAATPTGSVEGAHDHQVAAEPLAPSPSRSNPPTVFGAGLKPNSAAGRNGTSSPEPAPEPDAVEQAAEHAESAEQPQPAAPARTRAANYGATIGEGRPHPAGRFGPRRPLPRDEPAN